MRWQIAQFIFCDQQQTLTSEINAVQLEPMMVELLSYFCQHSNQIISKDVLIDQVWLGRLVSDNTVSKLITKLRKVFNDDVRQPKFIATFPKKGYKFIAEIKPISEGILTQDVETLTNLPINNIVIAKQETSPSVHHSSMSKFLWLLSISLLIMLATLFTVKTFKQQTPSTSEIATYAKTLTTDAGDEIFPAFSPDGTRVTYMSAKDDGMHLMIKNVTDERIIEILHGKKMGVGPANWSDDGTLIVYLVATPQLCQYYIRSISGLTLGKPTLIHNCPAGSYGKIVFTHDNDRLIYSESEGGDSPYELFEINLTTNIKKRLSQPDLFLGGNSQFDLHPTDNKLLISSPDKQQWEGFYSLDLTTDKLTLLFKQDAYICCGIWSHNGQRVVLMGEHPAYQLLSYDLTGQNKRVVYAGSRQISSPSRHSNGADYLFSSGKANYNIEKIDIRTQKSTIIANDSVDEKLAIFAHHNNTIAYIGLASGKEEVWLTTTDNNQRKKLTLFNDSRHYVDLIWSPDDNYLLGLTLNEIHLINATTGQFKRLKIPQTEIKGLSFKSNTSIAYSIKKDKQWRVYNYQLTSGKVLPEDPKWQFIQYQPISENTLWLNQDNQLFFGAQPTLVNIPQIAAQTLVNGRQFNLKKSGNLWLWFKRSEHSKIQSYSEKTKRLATLITTNVEHFDITNKQLLFGKIQQVDMNIYQTQSFIK